MTGTKKKKCNATVVQSICANRFQNNCSLKQTKRLKIQFSKENTNIETYWLTYLQTIINVTLLPVKTHKHIQTLIIKQLNIIYTNNSTNRVMHLTAPERRFLSFTSCPTLYSIRVSFCNFFHGASHRVKYFFI